MRKPIPSPATTLLLVGAMLLPALAATSPEEVSLPVPDTAVADSPGEHLALPGFWELRTEDVQRELELTAEQKQQIKAIGQEFFNELRRDWAAPRESPPGGDSVPFPESHEKQMGQLAEQIQSVFTADQLERLSLIGLRTRGVAALADPKVIDQLGITEVQQKRLRQLREQMQDAIRMVQQETLGKTLDELTPAQRRGLETLSTGTSTAPAPVVPST